MFTANELLEVAEVVAILTARYREQADRYEKQQAEHRASFEVRTTADAKIIAGLRADLERVRNSLGIQAARDANKVLGMLEGEGLRGAAERVVQERDGLLIQVQDMRAEMERLRDDERKAALKSQTPKHPVKVGEWVKAPLGTRGKVVSLGVDNLEVELTNGPPTRWWPVYMCKPCDPPAADHDTEAGKATAESGLLLNGGLDVRKVTT